MTPLLHRELTLKLVEEYAGVGSLRWRGRTIGAIPYRISRFQGMATSGLPIPGLHRIEGIVTLASVPDAAVLRPVTLGKHGCGCC